MNRIEITVTGGTQSGKSVILAAIDKAIKDLGVKMILSHELESERSMGNPDAPNEDELQRLKSNTYIVLTEVNIPRSKD